MEPKEMSKAFLCSAHQQQLQNNMNNQHNKDDIIEILGGIDNLLTNVLESNIILNESQLSQIYKLISEQKKQSYDKATFIPTFNFNDNNTYLYSLFGQQKGNKILRALQSKITILFLGLLYCGAIILDLCNVQKGIVDAYGIVIYWIFSVYALGWILYSNENAFKLCIKEFTFIFKMFYLLQYLLAHLWIGYFHHSILFYCALDIFQGSFLFLVMILDALNLKKEWKCIISTFATAYFAANTMVFLRMQYFPDLYIQTTITISNSFGEYDISLIKIAANAGIIVTIFLFKQMISTIVKPAKCTLIKITPFLKHVNYNGRKANKISVKQKLIRGVKIWRIICIIYCFLCLLFLIFAAYSFLDGKHIGKSNAFIIENWIFHTSSIIIFLVIGCILLVSNNVKYIWMASFIALFGIVIAGVDSFFIEKWDGYILGPVFLVGIISSYLLKVKEMEQMLNTDTSLSTTTQQIEQNKRNANLIEMESVNNHNITSRMASVGNEDSNEFTIVSLNSFKL